MRYSNEQVREAFEKVAAIVPTKLNVSGLESRMEDINIPDKYEDPARALLDQATKKRYAVRHPLLTGIPTLGLWPLLSRDKGYDVVKRKLLRKHPELRKAYQKARKENRDYDVSMTAADAPRAAAQTYGNAAVSIAAMLADKR